MRRSILTPLCIALAFVLSAQVNEVYVFGAVKDVTTAKKLGEVKVTVFKNGAKVDEATTNASGKYEFSLDYGAEYKLVWDHANFVEKNITIDTRNVAEELRIGGHSMNIEMTMLPQIEGIDYTPLLQPFGKANFNGNEENFTWDMEYTTAMRNAQSKLLAEYEKRQKQVGKADEDYDKLMNQGETAMAAKEFSKAVEAYNGALAIKSNDPQATARLSDAQMRLDEQMAGQKLEEKYAGLIKEADALFSKKEYENAKGKYQAALDVKENEAYPKGRIAEADKLIADQAKQAEEEKKKQEIQAKYDAAIAAADAAFNGEVYETAQTKYNEALQIKAGEKYPNDQLVKVAAKLKELADSAADEKKQKELTEKYNAAIAAADAAFNAANYEQARTKYTDASGLKPEEKYPLDQLKAIETKLAELADKAAADKKQKEIDDQYNASIVAADKAFQAANYDNARIKYEEAIKFKDEQYPKDQLVAITTKLNEIANAAEEAARQKKIDDDYKAVISTADVAYGSEAWGTAKEKYNEALQIKAGEQYPKDRIAAIDQKVADLKKQEEEAAQAKQLQENYDKAIAVADKEFNKKNFQEARAGYSTASEMKPTEQYPKERVAAIDAKLAEEAKQQEEEQKRQEMEARYSSLIEAADNSFKSQAYSDALNGYKNALDLKPGEKHPTDRIAEIGGLLNEAEQQKAEAERLEKERLAQEQRYNDLISQADNAFGAAEYDKARKGYEQAMELRGKEQYPKDQLKAIEKKLKELQDLAEQERLAAEAAASEGDRAEAERLRKEKDAQEERGRYNEIVAAGDMALSQKEYDKARERYSQALGILANEQYPKDKLAFIEATLAEKQRSLDKEDALAAKQREEAEAERLRKEREAEEAKLASERERQRLGELKDQEAQYTQTILDADIAYGEEDYDQARGLYAQAMDLKPDESYPPTRIQQIDLLLAEKARVKREAEELAEKKRRDEEERQRQREESAQVDLRKEEEAEKFMREARLREEAEKYERIKKLKKDLTEEALENTSDASDRRMGAYQGKQVVQQDGRDLYMGSEEWRQKYIDEMEAKKQAIKDAEQRRSQQAGEERNAAYEDKMAIQEEQLRTSATWNDRHQERVSDSKERSIRFKTEERKRIDEMNVRTTGAREDVLEIQQERSAMADRGRSIAVNNQKQLEDQQRAIRAGENRRIQTSEASRNQAMEKIRGQASGKPKNFEEYNRSKLALAYPEGVTEESYTEGNKVIIRRVVVKSNKADEYSKVIAKWGTFYFKNGQSITEGMWATETSGS